MKCPKCQGLIVLDMGDCNNPPELKCINCGKRIQEGGQKMEKEIEKKTEKKKKCSLCKQEKPATNEFFSNSIRTFDGLEYYCKPCKAIRQKNYREKKKIDQKSGDDRGKKNPISEGITLDAQLIRAVKKSAILDFVKNDLPQIIEKKFGSN